MFVPSLWHTFNKATMHRFYSCYNKCVKRFFGFSKYSSLTSALLLTGLPSCTTVIHNFNFRFRILISTSTNVIVKSFECVWVIFLSVSVSVFCCVLYLFLWTACLIQINEMKWNEMKYRTASAIRPITFDDLIACLCSVFRKVSFTYNSNIWNIQWCISTKFCANRKKFNFTAIAYLQYNVQ